MGGSLCLALKKSLFSGTISVYARRQETVDYALSHALCDEASCDLEAMVAKADILVCCVPVCCMVDMILQALPFVKKGAIITDVGSTKSTLHNVFDEPLKAHGVHFVGSHPVAGSEKTGVEYATDDLYEDAGCVLTKTSATDPTAYERVRELWELTGARMVELSPADHDRMLARTSHLPHLVSCALSTTIGRNIAPSPHPLCYGSGYRSMTRLADGSSAVWKDIVDTNREPIIEELEAMTAELQRLTEIVRSGDNTALEHYLRIARSERIY